MSNHITSTSPAATKPALFSGDRWFDPLEEAVRGRVRGFIEDILEAELEGLLQRPRYSRTILAPEAAAVVVGHRHGHRKPTLIGTFGPVEINVPRARLEAGDGATQEWKSASLQSYQRRTREAEALIAGAYLAGTNTRRVKRAMVTLFKGAIGKDVVSRAWRSSKRSTRIMRPPQQGHGAAWVWGSASAGASSDKVCSGAGALSSARALAMAVTRTPFARKP